MLTVTYYDDYAFLGANTGYDFNSEFDDGTTENKKFDRLRNRVTGSKVNATLAQALNLFVGSNVTYNSHPQAAGAYYYQGDGITLGNGFSTAPGQTVFIGLDIVVPPSQEQTYWYLGVSYYNRYGNVIQTIGDNHLGGLDKATSKYNFAGWVLETKLEHTTVQGTVTVRDSMEYDHTGRLKKVWQRLNGNPQVMLAANAYNELSQVIEKNMHSSNNGVTFVQSVDYTYNIRGWLTKMNDPDNLGTDLFAMELKYDEGSTVSSENPQYNGNISAMIWASAWDGQTRGYGYSYDQLNQLTTADYGRKSGSTFNADLAWYSVSGLQYDLNGNIEAVTRNTEQNNAAAVLDNLGYDYEGNRLTKVTDTGLSLGYDFSDGANLAAEYLYDANGNLIEDKNKGIAAIEYNHLNLPEKITFSSNDSIKFAYTSTGAKLRKEVFENGTLTVVKDYAGSFVYKGNTLEFMHTAEGRALPNSDGTFTYEYYLKDHLGNTRVAFDENSATVKQEDHYYRLKAFQIDLPPLRKRKEDIPLLVEHFLKLHAETNLPRDLQTAYQHLKHQQEYDWPGNIRELKHEVLSLPTSTEQVPENGEDNGDISFWYDSDRILKVDEVVEAYIRDVLSKTNLSLRKAAALLGVRRKTLTRRRQKRES